jgi:RNA polymerase sigma factor for flagellar operon FliA
MATAYGQTQATYDREQLILHHLPQVRWIAASIRERLPDSVSEDDLVSTGILGLIAAIDNFDPARNASLRTYAEYKIRGAILDSIKGMDGIAPHKRKRLREVQAAISAVEQRNGRNPTEEEIASELQIDLPEYHDLLSGLRGINLGSLDTPVAEEGEEGASLLYYIVDEDAETPAATFERRELEALLASAIAAMPRTEQVVIDLYFREELTLAEIARVINVHTSRVCQLKSQAILRLRSYMSRHWTKSR